MTGSNWFGAFKRFINQRAYQAPLRLFFIVPLAIQATVVVGIVGWLSIQNGQQMTKRLAGQLHREAARRIDQETRHLLSTAQFVNQLSAAAIAREDMDLETVHALEDLYWTYLNTFNTVRGLGVGNASGEILGFFKQVNDGETVYFLEYSDTDRPNQYISLTLDAQRRVIDSDTLEQGIDARERPWYVAAVQAGGPVWTDIYTSISDVDGHYLAMNASRPVYDERGQLQGVVSVILDLEQISTFLDELEVSPSSQIYIVDAAGNLVGSSDGVNPVRTNAQGIGRLAATDSTTPLIRESAMHLQQVGGFASFSEPIQADFSVEGDRHFLKVMPLRLGDEVDWRIVVAVPESDFTGEIDAQLQWTVVLCSLAALLSTAVSIIVGRWMSKPLSRLNGACRAVAQGELQQTVHAERICELSELAESFNEMARQLQTSFTQLKTLNYELSNSESQLRQFLEALPVGVAVHNQAGQLTYLNQAGRTLLSTENRYDVIRESGKDRPDKASPILSKHFDSEDQSLRQTQYPFDKLPIKQALAGEDIQSEDVELYIGSGARFLEVRATPIFNAQGDITYAIAIFQDITSRKRTEQHLRHSTLHDSLTGLPNRNLLMDRLNSAIARSQSKGDAQFAVLFIDLDRFKVVNDSLGHLAGDDLLIQVAHLLRKTIRAQDFAARLGGDEFVVLLEGISGIQDVFSTAQRIQAALGEPLHLQRQSVVVTASIGIVLGTLEYADAMSLLRDADTAMYQAKSNGKAQYEVFNPEMHALMLNRLRLENDLRRAIYRQEFHLLYQPIVNLATNEVYGFEALLRWQHPQEGLISPSEFIPVAEETGLIIPLGHWVLEQVCQQLKQWDQCAPNHQISICVNCSVKQLEAKNFLPQLEALFKDRASCRGRINLEITESQLIENIAATIDDINVLKTLGCSISIDDFGTGYSSLAYLSRLPVNILKVDRSFLHQIEASHPEHNIIAAILALSRPLGVAVVAEGIETFEQLQYLRHLGYEMGQGYFLAKPLPPEEALAFWQVHQQAHQQRARQPQAPQRQNSRVI